MFVSLWKRTTSTRSSTECAVDTECTISIERPNGSLLKFNGVIQVQSNGRDLQGYRIGDPYHCLRVYRLESDGYAVVIELHLSETETVIDAELVGNVEEADDFFCVHGGDYFHNLSLSPRGLPGDEKDREQRVLSRYDHQVLDVLKQLREGTPITTGEADRSLPSIRVGEMPAVPDLDFGGEDG